MATWKITIDWQIDNVAIFNLHCATRALLRRYCRIAWGIDAKFMRFSWNKFMKSLQIFWSDIEKLTNVNLLRLKRLWTLRKFKYY